MQHQDRSKQTQHEQENHNRRAGLFTAKGPALFRWTQRTGAERGKQEKQALSEQRWLKLPKKLPKGWPYALLGLGIVSAIALAFKPAPVAVDLAQVTSGPLQVTISAEGKTRVQERFIISAPVAGRLERIVRDVGDQVAAGDIVARLDPLPLNAQVSAAQAKLMELEAQISGVETQRPKSQELAQAEARLRSAQASEQAAAAQVAQAQTQWEQAKRDRDRTVQLESQGAVSRRDREAAETLEQSSARELEAARQQLQQATQAATVAAEEIPILQSQQRDPDYLIDAYRAQIAAVEAELLNLSDEASRTTIEAPSSGTILRLPEESARFVQAGDALVEMGNPNTLELVIDVLSTDAVKIQPGDDIVIQQWGGPDTLSATVSAVEPAAFTEISALGVEEQRVNVIGQLSDGDVSLGDGYRVEADIVIWQTEDDLQVPVSALFRCEQDWCVFTVEGDRARQRTVSIAQRNPFQAIVTDGLETTDTVILHPNETIEDGRKIKPRE